MLTYSVVVAQDNRGMEIEELILQTYSNEEAAKEHEKFVEDNQLFVEDEVWDYVFIRETHIADVFEGGDIDQDEDDERLSLEEYLNDLVYDEVAEQMNK